MEDIKFVVIANVDTDGDFTYGFDGETHIFCKTAEEAYGAYVSYVYDMHNTLSSHKPSLAKEIKKILNGHIDDINVCDRFTSSFYANADPICSQDLITCFNHTFGSRHITLSVRRMLAAEVPVGRGYKL